MLTFTLIGGFIIIGVAAAYYCDKIFGDAGILIAMIGIIMPLAYIVGTALEYLAEIGYV